MVKRKMILLINTCQEKLHYYEFVKPIEDILKNSEIKFFTKHYKEVSNKDLEKAKKVIICGTSLKDNNLLNNLNRFSWLKDFNKPVFGICAGMQIIGLVFGSKLEKGGEIGFYNESFKANFLGLKDNEEVYHIHNYYVTVPNDFELFANSNIPQAIKHKTKLIYGVLFHPEVRNKDLILNFLKIN
jgi:GMP synthase (glutamine-hydrolysing)